jgi:hypothetical protein
MTRSLVRILPEAIFGCLAFLDREIFTDSLLVNLSCKKSFRILDFTVSLEKWISQSRLTAVEHGCEV